MKSLPGLNLKYLDIYSSLPSSGAVFSVVVDGASETEKKQISI